MTTCRPLPDERPRQSVANLIGRFEQQNKRQSSSATSSIPRSTSVSSQIASDPVKEETKERREWPPKSVASASADTNVLTPSSSSPAALSNSPSMSPQPTPEKPAETITAAIPVSPEPAKPPAAHKQAAGKSTSSSGSRINPTSPAKPRPSTASVKSPAKSPPKSSSSSISQPLKPQHTGQSVNSNTSTVRSPPKSAPKSVPRSTPVTPSRPKTPAMHATNVSRPKTPSSGLFAPTAASLARSRNALPPAPPPVKKATLSSSAAERLSKPTAASMSKARTPAPAASPIRTVKSSTGSTHSPRGPSKLRVGLAPAKMKEAKAQQPASVTDGVTHEFDQLESGHAENGHDPEEEVVISEGVADLHDEVDDHGDEVSAVEEVVESVVEVTPEPDAPHIEVPVGAVVDDAHQLAEPDVHVHVQALVEESSANGSVSFNGSLESQEVAPATEETAHDAVSDPDAAGNDIEDMVTMLESVSITRPRPQSIASIPDEHGEIPDEEQS
ncbi:hypothetical protein AZE42_02383 [Rhizopogon vesiculosus]|uniref:Uncharacterized protein n=1 Tax=Rhizopogon vesiculosus TaxID=180088 RepID=A0A1J8PQH6_9AGAM|nr:hypothetical protein AZE42_02383 [Rhizopogon vesiculosus]